SWIGLGKCGDNVDDDYDDDGHRDLYLACRNGNAASRPPFFYLKEKIDVSAGARPARRDSSGLLLAVDLHYGVRRRVLSGVTLLADAVKRFPHVRFVAGDVAERAVENALHGEHAPTLAAPAIGMISEARWLVTGATITARPRQRRQRRSLRRARF